MFRPLLTAVLSAAALLTANTTVVAADQTPGVFVTVDEPTQAHTRIATAENEQWFSELIALNPEAFIHTVGQGICVTNPPDLPLKLPRGDVPRDVKLTTPK